MNYKIARHISLFLTAIMLVTTVGVASPAVPAHAATLTVNTTDDELNSDGDCSLREAIQAATDDFAVDACPSGSGDDIITVPSGTYTLTILGANDNDNLSGDLDIKSNITINGAGAANTIIQAGTIGYPNPSANGIDGVFDITGNHFVTFSGMTIANAKGRSGITISPFAGAATVNVTNSVISGNQHSTGSGIANFGASTLNVSNTTFSNNGATGLGGGLYTQYGATTITNSTFLNNAAHQGGGLAAYANATIVNSTFSGNTANQDGGAILVQNPSTVTISNSTIAGNTAGTVLYSGGLSIGGTSTLHLNNTIIANNIGDGAPGDCRKYSDSETVDGTNNLIEADAGASSSCGSTTTNLISSADPKLTPLTGNPAYFGLLSNSPALNAGSDSVCMAAPVNNTSQNGTTRPSGSHCEIGSFEGPGLVMPDLVIVKTNNVGGVTVYPNVWSWTITITNEGSADAVFTDGQILLRDNMPTNASYVLSQNGHGGGTSGSFLTPSSPTGDTEVQVFGGLTIPPGGWVEIGYEVTPSSAGVYNNPRDGGSCLVDPDNLVTEVTESNNSCSDSVTLIEPLTASFRSAGAADGYIVESGENTSVGGSPVPSGGTFIVGDYTYDRQVVAVLHFETSSLPNDAVIIGVRLQIKKQGSSGSNPFAALGNLSVDMSIPFFGAEAALKKTDFEASSTPDIGIFNPVLLPGGWFEANLGTNVSLDGSTQYRLHFDLGDNDDNRANFLRLFSGNYTTVSYRPVLIVEYYIP